ncbi:MAG: peptidase S41, partial [Paludibacteraceae bacterium]|nr:peptidase S41 [Paludibacteraceae bacterium]
MKLNKKSFYLPLILFVAVIFGLFLGNLLARKALLSSWDNVLQWGKSSKVDELINIINTNYVDTLNMHELTENVMQDVVSKLDPHSVYIP